LHFKVNGKPTPSPEAFVKAIEDIPDRQYFPVHWYDMREFRNMDAFQHSDGMGLLNPFDLFKIEKRRFEGLNTCLYI